MKINVHKHKTASGIRWVVSRTENGKRVRSFFETKNLADAERDRLREELRKDGHIWTGLTVQERIQLMRDVRRSKEANGATITEAAPAMTLRKIIDELITVKENNGRSEGYTNNLKYCLDQFAKGRETMPITKLEFKDVENFLNTFRIRSRPTVRVRISGLFKFCIRRDYRKDNPCDRLDPIHLEAKPPTIFTPEQFERCVNFFCKPSLESHFTSNYRYALPWFVLTACCGLRPEEAHQMTREDINLEEKWINVPAKISKTRRRRIVYPRPEALNLLAACVDDGRWPLGEYAKIYIIIKLRDHMGFKEWPKDITRHTAASCWLRVDSAANVAEALGNSERILKKHYDAVVTRAHAEAFWKACQAAADAIKKPAVVRGAEPRLAQESGTYAAEEYSATGNGSTEKTAASLTH